MNPLNRPICKIRYTPDMEGRRFWLWTGEKWQAVWTLGHDGESFLYEVWATGDAGWKRNPFLALCPSLTGTPGPGPTDAIYLLAEPEGAGKFPDIVD